MAKKHSIVVGLDIGTSKVCAVVGEMTDRGVEIVGIGSHPSQGLRKGVVVNIDSTVNSIKKAVEEAELMAGCEIHTVFTGLSGNHIKGFNSHGIVAVKNKEVCQRDLDRVIDAAKAVAIPTDREVLQILPQDYIIDDQDGIKEPLGMSGVRLEARVHIVTSTVTSAQNIVKCCNRAGLNIGDIILMPLAAAEAVLSGEERELGVALVDIGSGTTDIAVFHDGTVRHSAVLSVGGNHLTNDIAQACGPPPLTRSASSNATVWPKHPRFQATSGLKFPAWRVRPPAPFPAKSSVRLSSPAWKRFFSWCRERSQSRDTRVPWRPELL